MFLLGALLGQVAKLATYERAEMLDYRGFKQEAL